MQGVNGRTPSKRDAAELRRVCKQSQKTPTYTLKRALHIHSKEPYKHTQASPIHDQYRESTAEHPLKETQQSSEESANSLKRALHIHSKEPYIYTQKSPTYTLKRALHIHSKEPYIYTQKSPT